MSYFDRRLAECERIEHEGGFHWFGYALAWMALLFLGVIVIGVAIFAVMMVFRITTDMAVSNERVLLKRGLLNVEVQSMALDSVESIEVQKSFLGRVLGYGRVITHGTGDFVIGFPNMADPDAFAAALETARRARVDEAAT